jgi:hypothetical protein
VNIGSWILPRSNRFLPLNNFLSLSWLLDLATQLVLTCRRPDSNLSTRAARAVHRCIIFLKVLFPHIRTTCSVCRYPFQFFILRIFPLCPWTQIVRSETVSWPCRIFGSIELLHSDDAPNCYANSRNSRSLLFEKKYIYIYIYITNIEIQVCERPLVGLGPTTVLPRETCCAR